MLTVYLAGPITGVDQGAAWRWREDARRMLKKFGYWVLSPLRGQRLDEAAEFRRDVWDIRKADVVLIDYTLEGPTLSIGTLMEQAMAWVLGKYVLVVLPEGHPLRAHVFVRETASIVFEALDDALDYLVGDFLGVA